MPYEVGKHPSCPDSKPWTVLKQGTSEKAEGAACHGSKDDAVKQMQAIMASEGMLSANEPGARAALRPYVDVYNRHVLGENGTAGGQLDMRAAVDNSEWDGNAAMTACETAADYGAICAGRRDGDPSLRQTWALPHHKRPGAPPNADGVRNSLSRLPQTQGLVNREEAKRHLDRHMSAVQAQANGASPSELRQLRADTLPAGAARSIAFPSAFQVDKEDRNGKALYHLHGTATAYGHLYDMWDDFGPYQEGVRQRAGEASLAKPPDVAFLVNHKGITMARTTNDMLRLTELDSGLEYDAWLNAERQDVRDLVAAVEEKNITESSFAFMITRGAWNDDFTEFWIEEYDIDRGDVSAVNYGANPYTSVAARSREIMADLDHLPLAAARAAHRRLEQRLPDLGRWGSQTPPATEPAPSSQSVERQGASVNLIKARLQLMDNTRP